MFLDSRVGVRALEVKNSGRNNSETLVFGGTVWLGVLFGFGDRAGVIFIG